MNAISGAAWLLAWAAVGCVRPPLTSPLDGGAAWRELTSEHFVVQTDSSPGRARELVAELEQSFSLLQRVAFDYRIPLALKVRVVNLEGVNNLKVLGMPNAAGFARSAIDGFQFRQVIVLTDGQLHLDHALVQHELTHRFVAFYMPTSPVWLNEGLAEYYSTMTYESGLALVGDHLGSITFTANSWGAVGVDGHGYLGIPVPEVPTAQALLALTPTEFYSRSEAEDDRLRLHARYAGAWALVQTLFLEPNGPRRFKAYFDDLFHASVTESAAFQAHWGDLEPSRLQQDLEQFMRRRDASTGMWRVPVTLPPPGAPRERPMSTSEVHTLWAELREPSDHEADRDLQRAIEADPHNPEAFLQRAFRALATDEGLSRMTHDVNEAHRLAPDNPRYLLAVAILERELAQRQKRPARPASTTLLAARATDAPEFVFLAEDALGRRRIAAAEHYARKALTADPSGAFCYVSAAHVAAARLDYPRAVDAMRTALNLLADRAPPPKFVRELESYEALARSTGPSPTARSEH